MRLGASWIRMCTYIFIYMRLGARHALTSLCLCVQVNFKATDVSSELLALLFFVLAIGGDHMRTKSHKTCAAGSAIAAIVIGAQILKRPCPWIDLYSPLRTNSLVSADSLQVCMLCQCAQAHARAPRNQEAQRQLATAWARADLWCSACKFARFSFGPSALLFLGHATMPHLHGCLL